MAPPQAVTAYDLDGNPITQGVPVTPVPATPAPVASATPSAQAYDLDGNPVQPLATQPPPNGGSGVLADVTKGVGEGVLQDTTGLGAVISKIPGVGRIIPKEGLGAERQLSAPTDTAQKVGVGLENAGEFIAGDYELSGLAKAVKIVDLADKYPAVARALQMAKEHPVIAKIIAEGAKGGTVGAGQGAIKGAAEGRAKEGAESGAIGGTVGGATGSALAEGAGAAGSLLKRAAQGSGIGRESVDALTRAVRPTGKMAAKFPENAELALPRLTAANKTNPITNLDELSDAAHNEAHKIWNNEIVPQIKKYADVSISGKPVADAIRNGVSEGDKDLFEGATDAAETLATKFDGDMSLKQASDRMQSLNRKVANLYKLSPADRYAATANNTSLEAMEDGANALRQEIYTKLESLGERDPAGLRKTYGALKHVQEAAEKRATVYGRQNSINLSQVLSTAGGAVEATKALLSGHPMAALAGAAAPLVASLAKKLNAPEYLIQSALEDSIKEGAFSKILSFTGRAAKQAAPLVGGAVGTQTAQDNGQQ